MKKIINYYPTLNDELLTNVFPPVEYKFSYFDNDEIAKDLDYDDSVGDNITLKVKDTDWSYYDQDLLMEVTGHIQNGYLLYGKDGIAPKGSKICIGTEIYSQKSRTRDVIILEDPIDDDDLDYEYTISYTIQNSIYLRDVDITTFIFLKESTSKVNDDEMFLNNNEGVLLGIINHRKLFLFGSGSLFPIYLEHLGDQGLWKFTIDYEDPEFDKFSDCAKLVFNIDHKDYKKLDPNNKDYCDRLVLEIFSNSMLIVFNKLKEERELDKISNSYEDGSIMSLVQYYKDVHDFDFSNTISILDSMQSFIEKGTK